MNITSAIQLAAAAITLGAAFYLARFEYRLIEKLDLRFTSKKENELREDFAMREHVRFDNEFGKVWRAIESIQNERD